MLPPFPLSYIVFCSFLVALRQKIANQRTTDLFVLPSARGKGYGKQLLSAVAADAAAKGCDTMYWTTGHSNSKAQALYDRIAKSEQRWYYMGLPFKGWEADGGLESGSANRRLAP